MGSCDFKPDLATQPALLAGPGSKPASIQNPSCSSCHIYPLQDVDHKYHLISANANQEGPGPPGLNAMITCMDCHFNSIRHFSYVHFDTTWVDTNGDTLKTHASPSDKVGGIDAYHDWRPVPYAHVDTTLGQALATQIDSLNVRHERIGLMVEWMTSWAHNDGVVEVSFAPNNVTKPEFLATAYRAKDLSCSAISCHGNPGVGYRWASVRLGLGDCPSLKGNDPTCSGEVAAPAPKKASL